MLPVDYLFPVVYYSIGSDQPRVGPTYNDMSSLIALTAISLFVIIPYVSTGDDELFDLMLFVMIGLFAYRLIAAIAG